MLPKSISEEHFIRVIYDYLLKEKIKYNDTHFYNGMAVDSEDKEKMARIALGLHKEYWFKCMQDVRGKDDAGRD